MQRLKAQMHKLFDEKLSLKEALGYNNLIKKFKKKKKIVVNSLNKNQTVEEIDYNLSKHTKSL
jgi:hypothetical protein